MSASSGYTGDVAGRRPRRRPRAARADHQQARRQRDGEQRLPAPRHREPARRCSIDAAAEPEALRALIGDADLRTVVTTHGHWDHHRALPEVVEATGAVTVAHAADAADLPVPVQRTVEHGDTVTVGGQTLEVIHLRGHTPGSIALVWRGPDDAGVHVFTGDSLFPGGVGNTQKDADAVRQPDRRRRAAAVRHAARRDLGLPRPRQGHDARRRAPAPRRVARARLVTGG